MADSKKAVRSCFLMMKIEREPENAGKTMSEITEEEEDPADESGESAEEAVAEESGEK